MFIIMEPHHNQPRASCSETHSNVLLNKTELENKNDLAPRNTVAYVDLLQDGIKIIIDDHTPSCKVYT